jgi:hypothetical protein
MSTMDVMRSYRCYASLRGPDGNGWLFQEVTTGCPGASALPRWRSHQ